MYAGGNTRRRKDAPHCLSKTRRRAKRRFVRLISLHTARFWDIIMAIRKFLKGVLSNEIRNDQTRHRGGGQKVCEPHRALRLRPHTQERQVCRGREVHSRHFQPRPRRTDRARDRLRRLRRLPRRPRPLYRVTPRGGACISAPPCKCTRKPQKKEQPNGCPFYSLYPLFIYQSGQGVLALVFPH